MPEMPRNFLTEYLADRDEPCPSCRYSLKGLQGSVCPECGQALTIRIGLVEPNMAAWVFGLIGISAGLGFCVMLSVYFIIILPMISWDLFGIKMALGALLVGSVLSAIQLLVWTKYRGHVCRSSKRGRWLSAGIFFGLALICPLLFMVWIE